LLRLAQQRLTDRFWQLSDVVAPLLERWNRREVDDCAAADGVLKAVIEGRTGDNAAREGYRDQPAT
jgi:hypothetical protein